MAFDLKQPMSSLLVNGAHRFAHCWIFERTDSVVIRLTDHDRQLVVSGNTYIPVKGTASARQRTEGTSPQNADLTGQISSDMFTHADLRVGKYRGCKVTEFVVDWQYPFVGQFTSNVYYIADSTFDGEMWQLTIEGMKTRLGISVGGLLERKCRFDLGDPDCGVNLAAFAITGEVGTILSARLKFQTDLSQEDGWFDDGHLIWDSGNNFTVAMDVKAYLQADGVVEFQVLAPFTINPGDQFTVYPGCNKLLGVNPDGTNDPTGHCLHKFNNLANHGGWFAIPGNDDVLKTPDAKVG